MVDLHSQYLRLKTEIDTAMAETIASTQFIRGNHHNAFQDELEAYLGVKKVVNCANGTDALQIAMMALNLQPGDEVIVPAFTYVATAEVIGLLGLKPVMIDVDEHSFNINAAAVEEALSPKVKLLVPVHLFGQCTDMEPIMQLAAQNNLAIIEDTAQAIGADYTFANGQKAKAGCMGNIGTTSFFPSKNLGCYGDGGALYTNDEALAEKIRMVANHGQSVQYVHDVIGVNSRLDGLQAGILRVKLKYLDDFAQRRSAVAEHYDKNLGGIDAIAIPYRQPNSTHVFHQYTVRVKDGSRDSLKKYLAEKSIPSMIYYPKPLHHQKAFQNLGRTVGNLQNAEMLCKEVLSLPIHTEMTQPQLEYITGSIQDFFDGK